MGNTQEGKEEALKKNIKVRLGDYIATLEHSIDDQIEIANKKIFQMFNDVKTTKETLNKLKKETIDRM